ncbi:HNH endonuclease family protein [Sinomonas terrae]|uniref:HNH endonuclease family protein n=1 Tax=Sinomonas terrae TaxID=2908838 RepID=A0ABS9U3U5_9MICC|nr:HNH endonuclease family protein [Sinomonas terrae]MCH6471361.1 HNH endonuclease family protein [Sinomonas terrae]
MPPRLRAARRAGLLRRSVSLIIVVALAVLAAWLGGIIDPPGLASPAPWAASQIGSVPAERLATAKAALGRIGVEGRAPKTGYTRERFGEAWDDVDRNGCDTRNDVLARDLHDVVFAKSSARCIVSSGTLDDPYTAKHISFARGERSADVQIDHVVPLSDAWQKGAQHWSAERRRAFANDPANLLAVDGTANQQKGDGDLATWLPPQRTYRCQYAVRVVEVKAEYGLWMTDAEHRKAEDLLGQCKAA